MASENVPENSLHQNALSGTSSAMVYTSFCSRSVWRSSGAAVAFVWRCRGGSLTLPWRSRARLRWVCMADTLRIRSQAAHGSVIGQWWVTRGSHIGRSHVSHTSDTRHTHVERTSVARRPLVADVADLGQPCACPGPHIAVYGHPIRGAGKCAAGVRKVGGVRPAVVALAVILVLGSSLAPARSQPRPVATQGVPAQVRPEALETGAPSFTMPTVAGSLFPSAPVSGPSSSSGGAAGDGSGTLGTMLAQSWGARASDAAQIVGVTPVSLASACVMESGCRTNPDGSGTISGTFQMLDSTYTAMMASALARNPQLANGITPGLTGKSDPYTQSVAAAEYLRQGAEALRSPSIPDPTVLDVRGFYNFGPALAPSIARASDSVLMSDAATGLTAKQYAANGINPASTTVGQWRAGVVKQLGSAAQAYVLATRP